MQMCGIDFTNAPSRRKPLTRVRCAFDNDRFRVASLELMACFEEFHRFLASDGTWIADGLRRLEAMSCYGFAVELTRDQAEAVITDSTGDWLDAVLCAVQAGRAFRRRAQGYGAPPNCDADEAWIVDPATGRRASGNGGVN